MVIDYSRIKSCGQALKGIYSYILWDGWKNMPEYQIGTLYGPWGVTDFPNTRRTCGTVVDPEDPRELLLCASCCKRNGLLW